jgi:hypothetical protein
MALVISSHMITANEYTSHWKSTAMSFITFIER